MLNRYGLVEFDLQEADVELRDAERAWKANPDALGHKERFIRRLRHAGRDEEADALHIAPHLHAYREAEAAAERSASAASSRHGDEQRKEARLRREAAADKLHREASRLGRNAGEFLGKQKGESPYEHTHRLATLHGSHHYGTVAYTDGSHKFQFLRDPRVATHQAGLFHKSIQHHYPHWKPALMDVTVGDRVTHKGAVHFSPGDEWHRPHEDKKD